eukprot:scaffold1229_cov400-Prasinococcus_capsulatus_cf.AAC.2
MPGLSAVARSVGKQGGARAAAPAASPRRAAPRPPPPIGSYRRESAAPPLRRCPLLALRACSGRGRKEGLSARPRADA